MCVCASGRGYDQTRILHNSHLPPVLTQFADQRENASRAPNTGKVESRRRRRRRRVQRNENRQNEWGGAHDTTKGDSGANQLEAIEGGKASVRPGAVRACLCVFLSRVAEREHWPPAGRPGRDVVECVCAYAAIKSRRGVVVERDTHKGPPRALVFALVRPFRGSPKKKDCLRCADFAL